MRTHQPRFSGKIVVKVVMVVVNVGFTLKVNVPFQDSVTQKMHSKLEALG